MSKNNINENGLDNDSDNGNDNESDNLWSNILNSVKTSKKKVPSKNVLVLGEKSNGKSTLISNLIHNTQSNVVNGNNGINDSNDNDISLNVKFNQVKDLVDDDLLGNLNFYSIPSYNKIYLNLLKIILNEKHLKDFLIIIVLDWSKPWTFIQQLVNWFTFLDLHFQSLNNNNHKLSKQYKDYQNKLKFYLQNFNHHYSHNLNSNLSDDSNSNSNNNELTSKLFNENIIPLDNHSLTHNFTGLPFIIVCNKSDQIDFNQNNNKFNCFSDDNIEFIQQILRGISLKYGSALIYTSINKPSSFTLLRNYVHHRLFQPDSSVHSPRSFNFYHRPIIIERDSIFIPSGWDSWGKIKTLRDGIEPNDPVLLDGWDYDLNYQKNLLIDSSFNQNKSNQSSSTIYENIIQDPHKNQHNNYQNTFKPIIAEDENQFLSKHFESLSKDPQRDPRNTFKLQPKAMNENNSTYSSGLVGPMDSGSLNLPSVERALRTDNIGNLDDEPSTPYKPKVSKSHSIIL